MGDVTRLIGQIEQGDCSAEQRLFQLVYDELRHMAAVRMAREQPGQTLQPTALVHEVWLRLGADAQPAWQNRAHFFGAAAEAMRRILVENARRKLRLRRGGDLERTDIEGLEISALVEDERLVQVHSALDALAAKDPEKGEIVKLRVFVGLGYSEIAALLGVNEKTVRRHWEVAKVRLVQLIKQDA